MIPTLGNIQSPRPTFLRLLLSAVTTGTVANFAAIGTLGLLARLEGQGPLQPVNATSHWLHGPQAGRTGRADFEHTGVGYATNHAAAVFWALPFTWWLARRRRRSGAEIAAGALIDPHPPRRLTVRGSFGRNREQSALHLISAWASEQGAVLGQCYMDFSSTRSLSFLNCWRA